MPILMIVATVTGVSPMPEPIPKAVIATLFGSGLPKPVLVVLVIGLHLGYGGLFGAVLARVAQPVTIWKGFGLGVVLWFVMQVAFLPFLGWAIDRDTAATASESLSTAG